MVVNHDHPLAFFLRLAFYTTSDMLWAQGYVRQAISSSPRSSMYVNNTCSVSVTVPGLKRHALKENKEPFKVSNSVLFSPG